MPSRGVVTQQKVTAAKLERAREMRREPTQAEETLWKALRRGQLGARFRRQQVISGFIVDFYCHSAGLVIELDGNVHDDQEQRKADQERGAAISALGLRIQRYKNDEVMSDLTRVLERIRAALHHSPL